MASIFRVGFNDPTNILDIHDAEECRYGVSYALGFDKVDSNARFYSS